MAEQRYPPGRFCRHEGCAMPLPSLKDEYCREHTLGRFGHHPDPAIDFEVEVECLEAIFVDRRNGFPNPDDADLERRVSRALDFRVGGHPVTINAKDTLRFIARTLEGNDLQKETHNG